MKDWQGKRYWIVGASEGLGRELSLMLSRAGCEIIVSARSEDRLKSLVEEAPGRASYVTVDVSNREEVEKAAHEVGEIDGMIYLAGVYWPMTAQEWDNEQADLMGEINFLGASRCCGAVIGPMLERGKGHIVLTGSLSGFRGLPGAIGYSASKAAIMGLAETMRCDLRDTGVEVQLVNPGFIKTRLTDKNDFNMPFIMEPKEAAQEVFDHMNTDGFKKNFPYLFSLVFRLGNILPDWAYFRLFSNMR